MPPQQTTQSIFGSKHGNRLRKAHETHKADETEYSKFGDLPGGISGGVAQLVDCELAQYKTGQNQGEYYFRAAGIIVEPVMFQGMRLAGRRTQLMEALCDTKTQAGKETSLEEHYSNVLNELRKLGIDTGELGPDDLEPTMAALKTAGVFFKFSTRTGQVQTTGEFAGQPPRVFQQWEGSCEYSQSVDPASGTEDNSGGIVNGRAVSNPSATANRGSAPKATAPPAQSPKAPTASPSPGKQPPAKAPPTKAPPVKAPPKAPPVVEKEPFNEFENPSDTANVTALADKATEGDDDSMQALAEMARSAGYSDDEINEAPNWGVVVGMINNPKGDAPDDEPSADPATDLPGVGDVYLYTPMNPKTKQPEKKPVECEVVSVNADEETVVLKNLTNVKMTYKDVPFTQLISQE